MSKKLTFDNAYQQLQKILEKIQDEEVNIDELSDLVKKARELNDFCKTSLRSIKEEIEKMES